MSTSDRAVNWSIGQLVKASQIWPNIQDWSKERSLTTNIDIFGCLCKIGDEFKFLPSFNI